VVAPNPHAFPSGNGYGMTLRDCLERLSEQPQYFFGGSGRGVGVSLRRCDARGEAP